MGSRREKGEKEKAGKKEPEREREREEREEGGGKQAVVKCQPLIKRERARVTGRFQKANLRRFHSFTGGSPSFDIIEFRPSLSFIHSFIHLPSGLIYCLFSFFRFENCETLSSIGLIQTRIASISQIRALDGQPDLVCRFQADPPSHVAVVVLSQCLMLAERITVKIDPPSLHPRGSRGRNA
ncbi:hypothetical protein BDW42DRAFT_46446 [Aspergillus taichungensis]|uniref:Uncharacterized protein n=1 Tax=Aspergillus taichungensis TaxID=482145 RepID=A0A2J5HE12_9EURO|nr:hypothetical protein BDW42DRAFT_46446 [Aspergillus taichungensis]